MEDGLKMAYVLRGLPRAWPGFEYSEQNPDTGHILPGNIVLGPRIFDYAG